MFIQVIDNSQSFELIMKRKKGI